MKVKIILLFLALMITSLARAEIMVETSTAYHNRQGYSVYKSMENHIFLGMAFDTKTQFYVGLNASLVSTEGAGVYDTTEIGPRINYYVNQEKNWVIMLAYNLSVSSSPSSGSSQTTGSPSGHSFIGGIAYEAKINPNLYVGAGLMYHSITLKEDTTTISYNTTNPVINFSFRFK
jgi:hypothetical protein